MITDNQLLHRQYLTSDVWKSKRLEALAFYGCKCSRCDEYGTDVHHRTYVRTGGAERMSDLEVMCRSCHEAHHAAERCTGRRTKKRKPLNRQALYRVLNGAQKRLLMERFDLNATTLYLRLIDANGNNVIAEAERLLGCQTDGGLRDKETGPTKADREKERQELIAALLPFHIKPEKLDMTPTVLLRAWLKNIRRGRDPMIFVGRKGLLPAARLPAVRNIEAGLVAALRGLGGGR